MSRANIITYKEKINNYCQNIFRISISLLFCFSIFVPAMVKADSISTTTQFQDPNTQAADLFGYTVSLSYDGSIAVVGAPQYSSNNSSLNGATYVFTNSGTGWALATTLSPNDNAPGDEFGAATSITPDGSQIVVGGLNAGKAYIFHIPSGGWAASTTLPPTVVLTASDNVQQTDKFGWAVSQSNDGSTVLVTAKYKTIKGDIFSGQSYIYTAPTGGWDSTSSPVNETRILIPQTSGFATYFGWGGILNVDGTKAFISSPNNGTVYEFDQPAGGWNDSTSPLNETTSITTPGTSGDFFGQSLAITSDSSELVIGAPVENIGSNVGQGSIFVYNDIAGVWTQTGQLSAADGGVYDQLGTSLSISQDSNTILSGAPNHSVVDPVSGVSYFKAGAAYTFTNSQISGWSQTNESTASTLSEYANFGWSVSMLDSSSIFIGAPAVSLPPSPAASASKLTVHAASVSPKVGGKAYFIKKSSTPPPVLTPTISSFTASAGVGGQVTINGTNLNNASSVSFNGHSTTTFVQNNATQIIVTVPSSAQSGPIKVVTPNGTVTSTTNFTLNPVPAPSISSLIVPNPVLTHSVTIKGTNLLNTSSVKLNGLSLTIVSKKATAVVVTIPAAATSGHLVVTTPSGTVTSSGFVTVPAPAISSLSVAKQHVGKNVTIHGTTFIGVTRVTLNGVAISSFTKTATAITFTVPSGSKTGYIVVTSPSGTATSSTKLTIY